MIRRLTVVALVIAAGCATAAPYRGTGPEILPYDGPRSRPATPADAPPATAISAPSPQPADPFVTTKYDKFEDVTTVSIDIAGRYPAPDRMTPAYFIGGPLGDKPHAVAMSFSWLRSPRWYFLTGSRRVVFLADNEKFVVEKADHSGDVIRNGRGVWESLSIRMPVPVFMAIAGAKSVEARFGYGRDMVFSEEQKAGLRAIARAILDGPPTTTKADKQLVNDVVNGERQ